MKLQLVAASVVCAAISGAALMANDAISLSGVKCVVKTSANAKRETALDYKGGKLYFCCDGCRKEFEKDSAKFTTRANLQLAQTKQAKQTKCPMSGQVCKSESHIKVQGIEISFCCDGCKSTFEDATADEQIDLAFASDVFEKSFKMVSTTSEGTTFVTQPVGASSDSVPQAQVSGQTSQVRSSLRPRMGLRLRRR